MVSIRIEVYSFTIIVILNIMEDVLIMKLIQVWEKPSSVWELMEGVLTRAALVSMMFPHNYEGITLIRALHEVRYLQGLYDTRKEHLEQLTKMVNKVSIKYASIKLVSCRIIEFKLS